MSDSDSRDEARRTFIENFSSVLTEAGMPRMPARVFVALLSTDSGHLTAAGLAELLQVSPPAISGSIGLLTRLGLVLRQREPGSRRDQYHVCDDVWYEMTLRRDQVFGHWVKQAREGVELLGAHTPAGARLAESLAFFEFVQEELPALMERWHERKAEMTAHVRNAMQPR